VIKIFSFGDVNPKLKNKILEVINSTLRKLNVKNIYLEVYFFEELNELNNYLGRDYHKYGVVSSDIFYMMHDAYPGYPRIFLCQELLEDLSEEVLVGGIVHEVLHAILHGSIEYYIISPTDKLINLASEYGLNYDFIYDILYGVSVAVKDYEVTTYAIKHKLLSSQIEFLKHFLKISESERDLWFKLWSPEAKIKYLITIFKVCAATAPLLKIKRYKREFSELINSYLNYLPKYLKEAILKILERLNSLNVDTRVKIWKISDLVCDLIVTPILKT